jgi:hypothetical protein
MKDLSDVVCCFSEYGLFNELAVQASQVFKHVFYYNPSWKNAFPSSKDITISSGFDNITVIKDFWDYKKYIDFYWYPDIYDGDTQAELRSQRIPVWGSGKTEWLERDRFRTTEWMKSVGLPTPERKEIIGIDELRKLPKGWHIKLDEFRDDSETFKKLGDPTMDAYWDALSLTLGHRKNTYRFMAEKNIPDAVEFGADIYTVDGQLPTYGLWGLEVKGCGYVGKISKVDSLPMPLKKVNEKLSEVFKEEEMKGAFSTEVRITKDRKGYLIDPCFSEDTEILTNKGWKYFWQLDKTEEVATLETKTKKIVYQLPVDYLVQRYDGEMISISNRVKTIEKLVTPNHGVWRTDAKKKKLFVERADSLTSRGFIPRTGIWEGESPEYFELPKYYKKWLSGKKNHLIKEKICEPVKIPIVDWLKFIGYYLSEGSSHGKGWALNVSQYKYKEKMFEDLKKLPFGVTKSKAGIIIHSVQLSYYMGQFGLCSEKFVPDFIKRLNPNLIRIFLEAFKLGDGSVHGTQNIYFTTSKRLADDIQELIFKAGGLSNITTNRTAGTIAKICGKEYKRRFDSYIISESGKCKDYWFETTNRKKLYINKIEYHGFVYDVTVPNHTVYVRRNGKPFWSSNCMRFGNPPAQSEMEIIGNLPEIAWAGACGELVQPKIKARYCAQVTMSSEFASTSEVAFEFPESIRKFVKIKNVAKNDGIYYYIPNKGSKIESIGSIIGLGNTLDEAIEQCKKNVEQVKAFHLEVDTHALDEGKAETDKSKDFGISF